MEVKSWNNSLGWWVRHNGERFEVSTMCPCYPEFWGVRKASVNFTFEPVPTTVKTPQEAVLAFLKVNGTSTTGKKG